MARTSPTGRQLTAATRRRQVVEARVKGHTVRQIAKDLGIKQAMVRSDLRHALDSVEREDKKQLLELEMMRVDSMRERVLEVIESGGYADSNDEMRYTDVLKGVETYLKLQERVAKYTGLDATREDAATSEVDMWLTGIVGESEPDLDVEDILGSIASDDDIDAEL